MHDEEIKLQAASPESRFTKDSISPVLIPHARNATLEVENSKMIGHNTTLLPSVNTIARGMFCGAKCTHYAFTPIIKH